MSLTNRGKLFQAMQELFKEFDSCEQKVKKTEQIRDAYKGTAHRLIQSIKELKGRCADLQAELDKARSENCAIFKVHLSDESVKIAELNKEVADLQKENRELSEQLKNKSILDTVSLQKYWKQQNALESCERGEACEVELNNGAPFEKGYFLRLSKDEHELTKDPRFVFHIAFMKKPIK